MLAGSPRRAEVSARLVELDPQLAGAARTAAARTGLTRVEVLTGDAGLCDAYIEAVPANLVHPPIRPPPEQRLTRAGSRDYRRVKKCKRACPEGEKKGNAGLYASQVGDEGFEHALGQSWRTDLV